MAIQDIIKEIESETQKKIETIKQEGEMMIAQINKENSEQLLLEKTKLLNEAQVLAERIIEKAYFESQGETKDQVAKYQLKAINDIYLITEERLNNFSEDDYNKLLNSLWLKLEDLKKEDLGVLVAKERERETKDFFQKNRVKVLGEIDSKGGFIVKTKEVEIDCSFKSIIDNSKKNTQLEITKILFH